MTSGLAIGEKLRIVAPGDPIPQVGRTAAVVGRGAFGSGEHETTASCLELLETLPQVPGATLLDLGSGTGILAIAALKLGAARAICVDNDPRAVAVARRNAELNEVGQRIEHVEGELRAAPAGPFDLVLANIHGPVLLVVAEELVARVRPGGTLLLSGILWEDNWDVRRRYGEQGCELVINRMLAEYSTILLRKLGGSGGDDERAVSGR